MIYKDTDINIEIMFNNSDRTVAVVLSGFDTDDDAETYAQYLADHLPLMLFETKVIH